MRVKKWIIPVVAAAVVAAGLATVIMLAGSAKNEQAEIYEIYTNMQQNARETALTVTEDGETVGTYQLSQLGVLEDTLEAVDTQFDAYDRMEPEVFAEVALTEKLKWLFGEKVHSADVAVAADRTDLFEVMEDLYAMPRVEAQDAYVSYGDGSFRVNPEVAGTMLDGAKVQSVLSDGVKSLRVSTQAPGAATVELTEHSCYLLPEKTVENGNFDFAQELEDALQNVIITVDFQGKQETLSGEKLLSVLMADDQGKVEVRSDELSGVVAQWHETYRNDGVPYLFHAQVGGVKPIEFLTVDYEVDQEATMALLEEQLLKLESAQLEAVWHCWRDGEAFAIEGEYVEVDIPNQKMTYVKDGQVLVSTDVVTGASWGYPTPPGFYKVENKDTDCWLEGLDYKVFVDYWIGFIGYEYGIHDADWRTKFGGENYIKNGSHGCVNTPKEATATIFENIEIGVPVLVYGK